MGHLQVGAVHVPRFGYAKNFISSLTRLLRNPHILTHVANPNISGDGILRDDGDGSNTLEHPIFILYPDALRIRLYYDDVEVTDSLGSYHRKLGKKGKKEKKRKEKKEKKRKEKKRKERKGKERKGKERKGKKRKGKERKGKERKEKERKGKERKKRKK